MRMTRATNCVLNSIMPVVWLYPHRMVNSSPDDVISICSESVPSIRLNDTFSVVSALPKLY